MGGRLTLGRPTSAEFDPLPMGRRLISWSERATSVKATAYSLKGEQGAGISSGAPSLSSRTVRYRIRYGIESLSHVLCRFIIHFRPQYAPLERATQCAFPWPFRDLGFALGMSDAIGQPRGKSHWVALRDDVLGRTILIRVLSTRTGRSATR